MCYKVRFNLQYMCLYSAGNHDRDNDFLKNRHSDFGKVDNGHLPLPRSPSSLGIEALIIDNIYTNT